ncbi:unnamed protein product [Mesocestoides corti]|uniref:Uncharacterized protein n=1 Tax=Mesocestoides corti TaxID=53468 RepID=A0A158QT75_MESCO|nr:unnamed protein product [Mesocestoides corti]
MTTLKFILLLALVYTALADHSRHHGRRHFRHDDDDDDDHFRGEHHGEEDEEDDEEDDDDAGPLAGAAGTHRRSVIWRGPQSYQGYRSNKKIVQKPKPVQSSGSHHSSSSGSSRHQRYPQPPIHNRKRMHDKRYREGLQELSDLM